MEIRRADLASDAAAVAALIYDTDPYLFPFLFGRRARALPILEKLVRLDGNSFSYRHTWCAIVDGSVAGILIGYDHRTLDKAAEQADFESALPLIDQLLMRPKYWLLRPFLQKDEIDGRYIQNVSVHSTFRGRGIGSGLIRHFCALDRGTVWLDVEMENKEVKAMYEHLGFRVVREIPIFLPGLSSIRMVRG